MWPRLFNRVRPTTTQITAVVATTARTSSATANQSTISDDEVNKFSGLTSQTWWHSPEYAALRSMNHLRVPLIVDSLVEEAEKNKSAKVLTPYTLLDVGCGGGLLSEALARLGGQVTGIDPVASNIDSANEHKQLDGSLTSLKYICTDIETLASDTSNHGKFNAVIASEVLEHVSDVHLFLSSARDLLVPSGRLIITTINQTLASRVLAITVAEKILHLLPEGTHTYDKFVPLNGLVLMLNELGFAVESSQGMFYNPISGNWSWIASTAINYAVVAIKNNNSKSNNNS